MDRHFIFVSENSRVKLTVLVSVRRGGCFQTGFLFLGCFLGDDSLRLSQSCSWETISNLLLAWWSSGRVGIGVLTTEILKGESEEHVEEDSKA